MKLKWLIVPVLALAELFLCAAIIGVAWGSVGRIQMNGLRWPLRMFQLNTVSAQADEDQQLTVKRPTTLNIKNSNGKITVTGGAGDTIDISAHKTAWGANQADADAALATLKVTATQKGNVVTVQIEQPREVHLVDGGQSDSVELTIRVPSETAVSAHTDFGEVNLSGTYGDADLQSSAGAIHATDVNSGTLSLHSEFGEITIERSAGQSLKADTSSGGVKLTDASAEGEVNLSSDFGDIQYDTGTAGTLVVKTDSGGVKLTDLTVSGALTAKTDFGAVTLTRVLADSYDLHSSAGGISLDGPNGSVKADTDFGDVEVTNGKDIAQLDLQSSNGAIKFSGSLGDGPHLLKTDFGSIRLTLPQKTALTFDLKTDFGKIRSEFPMTINGGPGESKQQGMINGGGARLTAKTSSGNITLEILNP
jgi:DUF4097 and DUF4098 domain-containing protein YvlB